MSRFTQARGGAHEFFSPIMKAYRSENRWSHGCAFSLERCRVLLLFQHSDVPLFCLCVCVFVVFFFQHALRLLAFGQLYKVLNMDPLPASKPSPRLLEGVCSVVRVSSQKSVSVRLSVCVRLCVSFLYFFNLSTAICVLFRHQAMEPAC